MNNKLTDERLAEISEDGFLEHGDAKKIARELQERRKASAEPVIYQARLWNPGYDEWDPWAECDARAFEMLSQEVGEGVEVRKLYAAPQPALVVPDSDSGNDLS